MITKKIKKTVLLPGAIGDWTKYRPIIEESAKNRNGSRVPNRLSEKETLDLNLFFLEIFEEYAKSLQKSSGLALSTASCSIETDNYIEILKTVNMPLVEFRILAPGTEPVFLCFDMTLANALINSSVGGHPDSTPAKSLTEIEEKILEICASPGAEKLIGEQDGKIEVKYLTSPNLYFDQTIDESSVLIMAKAQLNFGNLSGNIILISNLQSACKQALQKHKKTSPPKEIRRLPQTITGKITMPVSSVLGNTLISAKDLYELEPGDVIVLDSSVNDLLQISIGEDLNILGQPGIKDDRLCVQIINNSTGRIERIKLKDPRAEALEGTDLMNDNVDENPGLELQEEQEFPKEEV